MPKKPLLKLNSFFSGIGGFDLAFDQIGIKPVFHCENNEFCISILKKHWPDAILANDIIKIDSKLIPNAEIWTGGFPCQDVSVARGWLGRDGLKGKNTGLFYPFSLLIKKYLPKVVLMENVTGLLNSHSGKDFGIILSTFNDMGYGVAWRILNTRYYGAPQSRPRVYICAFRGSSISALNVLFENGTNTSDIENPRLGFINKCKKTKNGAIVPKVAFCLAATSGRHTGTDWSRSYVSYFAQVRRLTPTECEKLQGFPHGWTLPKSVELDKIDSKRYQAIGNAVSVPVAKWIALRIHNKLNSSKSSADLILNNEFDEINQARKIVPQFSSKNSVIIELNDCLNNGSNMKWKSGGLMLKSKCIMAPVQQMPITPIQSSFGEILDKKKPDNQYFLSPNAAIGILRRVKSQNRTLFKPLELALNRLSEK